jgi:hypothetical protein
VLAESNAELGQLDNHLYRLEVQQATRQGQYRDAFSETLQQDVMYAAVAVRERGRCAASCGQRCLLRRFRLTWRG